MSTLSSPPSSFSTTTTRLTHHSQQCHRPRRRRRRPPRFGRPDGLGPQNSVRDETLPDALAHGRSPRRHQRRAGQHGRRLALAHVRHDQGVRLARGPGRGALHDAGGGARRRGAGEVRDAVFADGRRTHLSAGAGGPELGVWEGRPGASDGVCGRSDGPCVGAYAVWAGVEGGGQVFCRVVCARFDDGEGEVCWCYGNEFGGRRVSSAVCAEYGYCYWRWVSSRRGRG
jgi:hypothetical protein